MRETVRHRAGGIAARLAGGVLLAIALSACSTERPWWDGGPGGQGGAIETTPIPAPGRGGIYVVRPGDTLYKISREQNIPIRSLIDANDLQPPYALRSGQRIAVPALRYHVVQRGDTVYSISRGYGVDMATLTGANRIPPPYTIKVGERLQLPSRVNAQVATTDEIGSNPMVPVRRPGSGTVRSVAAGPKAPLGAPPARAGAFIWPARGEVISNFGSKGNGLHNDGINIAVPAGTPVKAAQSGVVAYAGNELKGYGNLLLVRHADGWMTAYAHNGKLLVKRGDTVAKGQTIALSGSSGSVTSPQVHFEVRKGAKAVDPRGVISG